MTCFQLPMSLCKRIQSVLTRFWWDDNDGTKKICWTSWDKMSKPKKLGGLGFRDIQLFNKALLAKQSWRILTNPQCLVARVLRGKYGQQQSFMDVKPAASCSHGWRGILLGRDLLSKNLGMAIGDGNSTRVWKDAWIKSESYSTPYGPPREIDQDLFVSDLLTRGSNIWNVQKVQLMFPELANDILCMWPSRFGAEDRVIWNPSKSGDYTTKSGYYEAVKLQDLDRPNMHHREELEWNKYVWSVKTLPKIEVFLWKILQDALPLGAALQRRGICSQAAACSRCGETETAAHLFLHCRYTKRVWSLVLLLNNPFQVSLA